MQAEEMGVLMGVDSTLDSRPLGECSGGGVWEEKYASLGNGLEDD